MQELIAVNSAPAKLEVNFEEIRDALADRLARYDVVVTADTVADAKKLSTELNKLKGDIAAKRKEEVSKVSAPIRAFDARMKELESMCQDGRTRLLEQIDRFEDKVREKCRAMLDEDRAALWAKHRVGRDFRSAEFDDLILVSNVTKTGNLTAKARNELESRVIADREKQERTDRRLLELENASFKAGLSTPLTREHVRAFLSSSDDVYQRELDSLIAVEIARQRAAEQKLRDKIERERRMQEESERREAEAAAREEQPKPEPEPVVVHEPDSSNEPPWEPGQAVEAPSYPDPDVPRRRPGNRIGVVVTCDFEIDVAEHVTDAAIEAELRAVLKKAGITTLSRVSIAREEQAPLGAAV